MGEEKIKNNEQKTAPKTDVSVKKKGGWFQKIPAEVLFSPGGVVLLVFAGFMELLDIIPLPLLDQLWELPLEIIFIFLLWLIAKTPLKAAIVPVVLERIPVFSDICPTWVIRLFI